MGNTVSVDQAAGYEQFFGFREAPFTLTPNTRFRFESASHEAALSQVTQALTRREPVVVVIGEIGTGKTLLCRTVIERLDQNTFLSIIGDPQLELDELLKRMLQDFGVISKDRTKLAPTTRHDLVHALQEFLSSLGPLGAHAVVIIDEAQHAQPEVLEQIRLIANVQDDQGSALQIILLGQADLEPLLARPELRQLRQRVSRLSTLEPLRTAEVERYIDHRLSVARSAHTEMVTFTPDAIEAVARRSRGVPRLINVLCDRALESAYARQSRTVDLVSVETAAALLKWTEPEHLAEAPRVPASLLASAPEKPRSRRTAIVAASIVVAAAALLAGVRVMNGSGKANPPARTVAPPPAAARETAPSAVAPPSNPPAAAPLPSRPEPSEVPTNASAPRSAVATEPPADTFEIIVASFRTIPRAADVADAVTGLGLPVRRRSAGDWYQVLAGPFRSKADADAAQQRLDRAGLTGTKVVRTAR